MSEDSGLYEQFRTNGPEIHTLGHFFVKPTVFLFTSAPSAKTTCSHNSKQVHPVPKYLVHLVSVLVQIHMKTMLQSRHNTGKNEASRGDANNRNRTSPRSCGAVFRTFIHSFFLSFIHSFCPSHPNLLKTRAFSVVPSATIQKPQKMYISQRNPCKIHLCRPQ